jgi:hypothetical protein
VPRSGYPAFLVLFIIAAGGGGPFLLYISDIDNCPDSHLPLFLSFRASPYPLMLISFPFSFSAGSSDGGSV